VSAILTENLAPMPIPVRASAAPQVVFGDPFMAQ